MNPHLLTEILFRSGITAGILLPVTILAGFFLYKKFQKKFIPIISGIICFFCIIVLYLAMPLFIIFLPDLYKKSDFNMQIKCNKLAEKLTPFTGLKSQIHDINSVFYWTEAYLSKDNKKKNVYANLALENNIKACNLYPPATCYMGAYIATVKGDYKTAEYLYIKGSNDEKNGKVIGNIEYLDRDITPSLIHLYILKKDYESAFKLLQQSKYKNKDEYFAEVYLRMKDYDNALKYANKLLKKSKHHRYYRLRSLIYYDMGKTELSKKDFMQMQKERNSKQTYEDFVQNAPIEAQYKNTRKDFFGY